MRSHCVTAVTRNKPQLLLSAVIPYKLNDTVKDLPLHKVLGRLIHPLQPAEVP